MAEDNEPDAAEQDLVAAARAGRLLEYLENNPEEGNAALYKFVSKIVFNCLTRTIERRRGHARCGVSIQHLEPDCYDCHQDDVLAVREDLLAHADQPIDNLGGFVVSRLKPATINAHRRRRGERGAPQRPRLPLPQWLAGALNHDQWLQELAVEVLIWAGVPTVVPNGLWPLRAWAERRAEILRAVEVTEVEVAKDVEQVLAAMRMNRTWYERYVERPLGHKQVPVIAVLPAESDRTTELPALSLVERYEIDDAHLRTLAGDAIDAIENLVAQGEDIRPAVVRVITALFGDPPTADGMDRPPHTDPNPWDVAADLATDDAMIARIVDAVLQIIETGR